MLLPLWFGVIRLNQNAHPESCAFLLTFGAQLPKSAHTGGRGDLLMKYIMGSFPIHGHLNLASNALIIVRPTIKLNLQVSAAEFILRMEPKLKTKHLAIRERRPALGRTTSGCLVLTSARVPSDNKQVVSVEPTMKTMQDRMYRGIEPLS